MNEALPRSPFRKGQSLTILPGLEKPKLVPINSSHHLGNDTEENDERRQKFLQEIHSLKAAKIDMMFDDSVLFPGFKEVDDPTVFIENMTDEQRKALKQSVIQKYGKDGRGAHLSNLREQALAAKKYIKIHQDVKVKETLLRDLESELSNHKARYNSCVLELINLSKQIVHYLDSHIPPFVTKLKLKPSFIQPLKDLPDLIPKDLQSIPEDLVTFQLAESSFILTDPGYKLLHDNFLSISWDLIESISLVEKYEREIIPHYRELVILEVQEDRIASKEQELKRLELMEKAERVVRKELLKESSIRSQKCERAQPGTQPTKVLQEVELKSAITEKLVEVKIKANLAQRRREAKEAKIARDIETSKRKHNMIALLNEAKKLRELSSKSLNANSMKVVDKKPLFVGKEMILEKLIKQTNPPKNTVALRPASRRKELKAEDACEQKAQPPDTAIEAKELKHLPSPKITKNAKVEIQPSLSSELFITDPPEIYFLDYLPGMTYTKKFRLTNVSSCVNRFRLSPITDYLSEFFQISYTPPGKMSAGMTCDMSLTFTPDFEFDADIDTYLCGTAEFGGSFKIRFGCKKRKCLPFIRSITGNMFTTVKFEQEFKRGQFRLTQNYFRIDFGKTVAGGSISRCLNIKNKGYLPCHVTVSSEDINSEFSVNALKMKLDSFGIAKFEIRYRPNDSNEFSKCKYIFSFTAEVEPILVECIARRTVSPLSLATESHDFGLCVAENKYVESISLENHGPTSLKFEIVSRRSKSSTNSHLIEIQDCGELEISPKLAVVQAMSAFPIRIKFTPSNTAQDSVGNSFLETIRIRYFYMKVEKLLECSINGRVTNSSVLFEFPSGLNFGSCSIYECVELPCVFKNLSEVPQSVAFQCSSQSLFLINEFGESINRVALDSKESSLSYSLRFIPNEDIEYIMPFTFKGIARDYAFSAIGSGFRPDARFSSNVIEFPPTALGSTSNIKVTLSREEILDDTPSPLPWKSKSISIPISNTEIFYEFLKPIIKISPSLTFDESKFTYLTSDPLPLKVFPTSGVLLSGKRIIELAITPSLQLAGVETAFSNREKQIAQEKKAALYAAEEERKEEEERREKEAAQIAAAKKKSGKDKAKIEEKPPIIIEPKFKPDPPMNLFEDFEPAHATLLLPCRIITRPNSLIRNQGFIHGNKITEKKEHVTYLEVHVDITKPQFVVETWPKDFLSNTKGSMTQLLTGTLNFGIVPVGEVKKEQLTIRNCTESLIELKATQMNPQGPFYLCKALRQVVAGDKFEIKLSFEPKAVGEFQSTFTLVSGNTAMKALLFAEAVVPNITVDQAYIDYGDILVGDQVSRNFQISNPCHFPIICNFDSESIEFTISPLSCLIEPGQSRTVAVNFCPQIEDSAISRNLTVKFWGQQSTVDINLIGKAWGVSSCISGYDGFDSAMNSLNTRFLTSFNDTAVEKLEVDSARLITCTLRWKNINDIFFLDQKEIRFSNIKQNSDQKLENVGKSAKATIASFTIERVSEMEGSDFQLDLEPSSGNIEMGAFKDISFKLTQKNSTEQTQAKKASKKAEKEKEVGTLNSKEPVIIINYFKVTFKGGYKCVEPKGICERKDWLIRAQLLLE